MNNTHRDEWERFLNPEVLRANLMLASIYIASYEILKDSIINPIKDFYINRFKGNDYIFTSTSLLRISPTPILPLDTSHPPS